MAPLVFAPPSLLGFLISMHFSCPPSYSRHQWGIHHPIWHPALHHLPHPIPHHLRHRFIRGMRDPRHMGGQHHPGVPRKGVLGVPGVEGLLPVDIQTQAPNVSSGETLEHCVIVEQATLKKGGVWGVWGVCVCVGLRFIGLAWGVWCIIIHVNKHNHGACFYMCACLYTCVHVWMHAHAHSQDIHYPHTSCNVDYANPGLAVM